LFAYNNVRLHNVAAINYYTIKTFKMRKHLMRVVNANFSRFFKAAAVVVIITMATGAKAQVTPVSATISEVPAKAAVTFIATGNESLFFDVKVSNEAGEKFTILVKDDNSTTLYRGSYSDRNFKKRFVLPKTDTNKLTFLIRSESGLQSETFEINTNTRVIEEVSVRRVM
jgi:hypothetical protein